MISLFKNAALLSKPLKTLTENKMGENAIKKLSMIPQFNATANLKTLAIRMKSIGSIKKITKAM